MSRQVLICGDPASGKSTSLLTALLSEGVLTYVADFDGDVDSYRRSEHYRKLSADQQALLTYQPMVDTIRVTSRKVTFSDKRVETVVPSATVTAHAIEKWLEVKEQFFEHPVGHALVIDSGTNFSESIAAFYHALNKKGLAETLMGDYSSIYKMERALYSELRSFPCMVFVTCHLQHLSLGNFAGEDAEKGGRVKSPDMAQAMAQTETRWPSFFGRKTAREKPLLKDFSHALKIEVRGKRRVILSEPDDDTTFLHSSTNVNNMGALEGLVKLVKELKDE